MSRFANPSLLLALCVVTLFLISPVTAWSQVLYGSIVGNVKDASGAAVPGATVTITSKETSQVRSATTNDDGGYSVSTVQSGTYDIKATKGIDFVPNIWRALAVNPSVAMRR